MPARRMLNRAVYRQRKRGGLRYNLRGLRMKSSIARAFSKANLQRHISKTFLLNGENLQSWFYNRMYNNVTFTLNQLAPAEVVAIQELYDFYRIDGIKLEFYPQWNSAAGVNAQPEIGLARLTYAIDTNPGAPPAAEGDLLQHRNCKSPLFTRVIKTYAKVHPQSLVFGAPGNPAQVTGPDSMRNMWIQTAEAAVPHYGINFIASTLSGVANETSYRILATFYMTFKGQR